MTALVQATSTMTERIKEVAEVDSSRGAEEHRGVWGLRVMWLMAAVFLVAGAACGEDGSADDADAGLVLPDDGGSAECIQDVDCAGMVSDPCQTATCDQGTGECVVETLSDDTVCDDGSECTFGDSCQSGVCGGTASPDGATCDDGDACTVDDACSAGACVSGDPLVCDAPEACQDEGVCNSEDGTCSYATLGDGTPCDDGESCTAVDTCSSGTCVGASPLADDTDCDDNNLCTQGEKCQSGTCTSTNFIQCLTPGLCEKNDGQCEPELGCVYSPNNGAACSDEDCHVGFCADLECIGATDSCSDAPIATCDGTNLEIASPVGSCGLDGICEYDFEVIACPGGCNAGECLDDCASKADGEACDDGNLCTENDVCSSNACVGTPKTCADASGTCQTDACNPTTGLCEVQLHDVGTLCDDGDTCTVADTCDNAGTCIAGDPLSDAFEPNETVGTETSLQNVSACSNNLDRQALGVIGIATDEDWYTYRDLFGVSCSVRPTIQLTNLHSSGTYTLCGFHECANGNPATASCLGDGSAAGVAPTDMAGCCVEVPVGETRELRINPECGGGVFGSDAGDVHFSVESADAIGECGYEVNWGDTTDPAI